MSYQTSSSYKVTSTERSSSSNQKNIEGEIFDLVGDSQAMLRWSESHSSDGLILNGSSDVALLSNFKGALLKLKDEFFSGRDKIVIAGEQREQLDRRLLLLEH